MVITGSFIQWGQLWAISIKSEETEKKKKMKTQSTRQHQCSPHAQIILYFLWFFLFHFWYYLKPKWGCVSLATGIILLGDLPAPTLAPSVSFHTIARIIFSNINWTVSSPVPAVDSYHIWNKIWPPYLYKSLQELLPLSLSLFPIYFSPFHSTLIKLS